MIFQSATSVPDLEREDAPEYKNNQPSIRRFIYIIFCLYGDKIIKYPKYSKLNWNIALPDSINICSFSNRKVYSFYFVKLI